MSTAKSAVALAALVALFVTACGPTHITTGRRVVVLGIDGFDYHLARDLMARGRLPHLSALAAKGKSTIRNIGQIERGYHDVDGKLRALGAKIERVEG